MHRTILAVVVAAVATQAAHDDHGKGSPTRKLLSEREIVEKLDGKAAKATTVELTLEPGQSSPPHRHPGPVFGYIIEGEYDWAIDDKPARTLKAGETFYEPTGCLHRVSKNASEKNKARVLAVLVLPADAKEIAIPEKPQNEKAEKP